MTPDALSAVHALSFGKAPRPWSAEEFAALLADPGVTLFTRGQTAFLLARRAGPEAEILTLCTHPDCRQQGLARGLLSDLDTWAVGAGVTDLFLEVAETNTPARRLYGAAGFTQRGLRKDYYRRHGQQHVCAIVMGKSL